MEKQTTRQSRFIVQDGWSALSLRLHNRIEVRQKKLPGVQKRRRGAHFTRGCYA